VGKIVQIWAALIET